ncbi:MAG: L-rhamnose mutarotase [Bacteroidetes bacterium]|nr:L-rhamnose mutarotase [Bacteroidota bacterium]
MKKHRYCLTLDLKDDPVLIAEYKKYHQNVWPEIKQSIKNAGIMEMEIYLIGNRMFMIIDGDERFSLEEKARMDLNNPKVQEWEKLMWKFQQATPWVGSGEKWAQMECIFKL